MSGNTGWTAQSSHGWIHDEGAPGQTFKRSQLPDPEQQRKGGVDPDLYRAGYGLWIEEDPELPSEELDNEE